MFRKMNNGNIVMTRGDTGSLTVTLNKGSTVSPVLHELVNGDKVYLGLMEANADFEDPITAKIYNATGSETEKKSVVFNFTHKDTVDLLPGNYYYEVKLTTHDTPSNYKYTFTDQDFSQITIPAGEECVNIMSSITSINLIGQEVTLEDPSTVTDGELCIVKINNVYTLVWKLAGDPKYYGINTGLETISFVAMSLNATAVNPDIVTQYNIRYAKENTTPYSVYTVQKRTKFTIIE